MARDLPAALAALVRGVTAVHVIAGGVAKGRALGDRVLARLTGDDAAELLARLAVAQPPMSLHCMCLGDPALELWVGDRRRVTLGLHHGHSLRVDGWWSDAPLRDGEALLRLLAEHGVPGPLATLLAEREAHVQAGAARRVWLAACPESLHSSLPALEGAGLRLPRSPRPDEPDVLAAAAAVRAALGSAAPAALLAWFGAGAGPWSGYPAYEQVAEALLATWELEALVAAASERHAEAPDQAAPATDRHAQAFDQAAPADEPRLLGLARFLARHGAPPRERDCVAEDLRRRLRALVERRCDADARARFAAWTPTPDCDGLRLGDAAYSTNLAAPVRCGDRWVALDGDRIVRFDPGEPRGVVLATLPSGAAELAAAAAELVVTLRAVGEVWRVPLDGGPPRVVARGQADPCAPTVIDGRAAWLEQPRRPDHRTATRLRLEGRAEPLAAHTGNAWDLLVCAGALYWARHGGSWWQTLFGRPIHRADLLRCDPRSGRSDVVAELPGGDDGTSVPRLASDGRQIAWTSGQRVGVLDPRDGARRWFDAHGEPRAVLPHGLDVLAVVVRDRAGALVRLGPAGARLPLARWRRDAWEREQLAVLGERVVWTAGEHLWARDLPADPRS